MRKIDIWRDPFDSGYHLCEKGNIEFKEGFTVLVGCNGSGKTTMLHNIKEKVKKEDIPVLEYNNLHDGGSKSISEAFFDGDYEFGAMAMTSSEGENINLNIGKLFSRVKNFLETGKTGDKFEGLAKILIHEEEKEVPKERWILLDAVDSGYSIDNIVMFKEVINLILEDSKKMGIKTYIIASANEYELANGEDCLDVISGNYINFSDYNEYRNFIIETSIKKEERFEEELDERDESKER